MICVSTPDVMGDPDMPTALAALARPMGLAAAVLVLAVALAARSATAQDLPLVVFVTTGGTIAQKADPASGGAVPAVSGDALVAAVPGLDAIARTRVVPVANIDSRDMTPALWLAVAKAVNEALDDDAVAGVVVVHGTDTMQETAYFLDRIVSGDKPVVLTGAMRDASDPYPDGPDNLRDAALQAAAPSSRGRGVTVTLNGRIVGAAGVAKVQTDNVAAFGGGERGLLGVVDGLGVHWYGRPEPGPRFALPETLPDVAMVVDYPGSDGRLLDAAVADGAAGVVVVGYGIGNVSAGMFAGIERAATKGVPLLLTTRVPAGRIHPAYGGAGGGASLRDLGVVFGADVDPWKNRILMMLALGTERDRHTLEAVFR